MFHFNLIFVRLYKVYSITLITINLRYVLTFVHKFFTFCLYFPIFKFNVILYDIEKYFVIMR